MNVSVKYNILPGVTRIARLLHFILSGCSVYSCCSGVHLYHGCFWNYFLCNWYGMVYHSPHPTGTAVHVRTIWDFFPSAVVLFGLFCGHGVNFREIRSCENISLNSRQKLCMLLLRFCAVRCRYISPFDVVELSTCLNSGETPQVEETLKATVQKAIEVSCLTRRVHTTSIK